MEYKEKHIIKYSDGTEHEIGLREDLGIWESLEPETEYKKEY